MERFRTVRQVWILPLACIMTLMVLTTPSVAMGDDDFAFQKKRIEHLQQMARQLEELRMPEEAQRMRARAHYLGKELEERIARDRAARAKQPDKKEIHQTLEQLEKAHHVTGRMGLREAQEHIEITMKLLKQRLVEGEHQHEHDEHGHHEDHDHGDHEESDHRAERSGLEQEIEIIRLAMKACREAEKAELVERLEHAVHARELRLKGRKDKEAITIMEGAPRDGAMAELLGYSARLWDGYGHERKAKMVGEWSRKFAERSRARTEKQTDSANQREIDAARRQLRILRTAFEALEGHPDARDRIEHAIHVRELNLEGRRDEEARAIRKKGPNRGEQAKLLFKASRILAHQGKEEAAKHVAAYASELRDQHKEIQARRDRELIERKMEADRKAREQDDRARKERKF